MKNLQLPLICIIMLLGVSCSKDDDNNTNNDVTGVTAFSATINGGTYSNYDYDLAVYTITKNGNTMSIDVGDQNGDQITIFLNGTNGFDAGTEKVMGNTDDNNFVTYTLIRQASTQLSYYSSGGTVTITQNVPHPTEANTRLISGDFNITTATTDGSSTTVLNGSFSELGYTN